MIHFSRAVRVPFWILVLIGTTYIFLSGCEPLVTDTKKGQDPNKPSFGNQRVQTQHYVAGVAIPHLSLPTATGGDGRLAYSLSPPEGLSFDAGALILSGSPADTGNHLLKYRVTDADGDFDELSFRVEIEPLTTIYWSSSDGIHRTDLLGNGDVEEVLSSNNYLSALALGQQHLYYVEGSKIRRANLDGSATETIVTMNSSLGLAQIAVDYESGMLYWPETDYTPVYAPADSPLDEEDLPTPSFRIRRTDLHGGAEEGAIVTDGEVFSIVVDSDNRKLLWSQPTELKVRRANLDGSAQEDILEGVAVSGMVLVGDRLYFIEVETDSDGRIWSKVRRSNLDGSDPETIVEPRQTISLSLTIDLANNRLYWNEFDDSSDLSSGNVLRAYLDGGAEELVAEKVSISVVVDSDNETLYYTTHSYQRFSSIHRANLDGSNAENIVESRFRGIQENEGIALDVIRKKLYWVEEDASRASWSRCSFSFLILEADLDGRNERIVIRLESVPENIELDVVDRKLYWYEGIEEWTPSEDGGCSLSRTGGIIRRANVDGSSDQKLVTLTQGGSIFDVDAVGRKLYWSDVIDQGSSFAILRADLDGTDQETVVGDLNDRTSGIALDIVGRELYWYQSDHGLFRSDLDGSGTVAVFRHGDYGVLHAVDGSNRKIYWIRSGSGPGDRTVGTAGVIQTNLDGSNARVVVDDIHSWGQFALGVR